MNVGLRWRSVPDPQNGIDIPLLVLYPTLDAERDERLGPYSMHVALDGEPAGASLPLVAISHGMGSSPLVLRTLGEALARNSFVVAIPQHPGDNRDDRSLSGTVENLEQRPRHLQMAIDAMFDDKTLRERLLPDKVWLIGHSLGGYTALALAGGKPMAFAHETPGAQPRAIAVTADPRVQGLVLLAPAVIWYREAGALADVSAPILLLTAEHDEQVPAIHAAIVRQGVLNASQVTHRVVPNAGHYAFLSPFPMAMAKPWFAPARDPAGFDRVRFHETLPGEIAAFLRAKSGALDRH